jgi:DNA-directed RNA polymerase subunit RPC12/RpoP
MQGYTHTCAACDAKLKIHERYVGRSLHCPSCGGEFLADPTLVDVDELLPEDEKRKRPWLAIITGLTLVTVVVLWLGQADQDGFLGFLFKPNRVAGQFALLDIEGRERVPAAMDHETVVFVVDALGGGDPDSLETLNAEGRIIHVASGTKIKVIERIRRDRVARVRVLEGAWTGRVLWVPELALN